MKKYLLPVQQMIQREQLDKQVRKMHKKHRRQSSLRLIYIVHKSKLKIMMMKSDTQEICFPVTSQSTSTLQQ